MAETFDTEMPDLDLFVGTGTTPSLATEVCASATATATEHCEVADPVAGTWWVLIQNWAGTTSQPDAYTLATAVVPADDLGNAGVDGPEVPLAAGEPYDIRFHWDIPEMVAGDRYYGTIVLGSSPATPGDIGSFPVTLLRAGDDVAKTASAGEATLGDTVSYEITIQPNVTPTDLVYTIVDTVPDGLTIDPASVTGDGVVDGQTITWEVLVPSPVGKESAYVSSTPATSAQCAAWTGFIDLAPGIPFAGLDGDSVSANAFSAIGPFNHYGEDFPNLTVAEDGLVTMAGGYGGAPWVPQAIPNPAAPNGVLAPLWSDLELSLADGRGMRLAQSTTDGVAIVQWDDPFEFTEDNTVGPSVGKFQAWIYNSVDDTRPEMTFEYGAVGALPGVATIGTESISGETATAVLGAGDPAGVVSPSPGGSFCLDYEGPSFDPITVGYDVTVHEDALTGTYTNLASHITDDPYAKSVVASFDLEVDGNTVTSLNVSPSSAKLKAKAATQQFTARADLSGGGTIDVTDRATWSSGNPNVVTINATGLATAVGRGKATISASFGGKADTAAVHVAGKVTAGTPFNDLGASQFAHEIAWLYQSGITGGCTATRFCPTNPVTREQMAAFLNRAIGLPSTGTDFFDDDDGTLFERDINRLAAAGFTGGCATRRFCPDANVTREQMASFLTRAFDLPATSTDFFTDDNTSIHEGSINRLAASGITGGCAAGRFCPTSNVTREQMAAFLYRVYN